MGDKARVLLVGSGGIGTITALNLERGGLASVTAVLRSNYNVVKEQGFTIDSCDHGSVQGWRPSESKLENLSMTNPVDERGQVLAKVPDVSAGDAQRFDFIVCTTKNIPDVPPALTEVIKPAVTPGHSVIVLVQNGLNIEQAIFEAFPTNICLSGVSLMGADELSLGHILENDHDRLFIGPFRNRNIEATKEKAAAEEFVRIYSASGKADCSYQSDVLFVRWRKLMYNAVWNPICALTGMDTSRLRLASGVDDPASPINLLVKPAMNEIRSAALAAANVQLPESLVDSTIECDPLEIFCAPSMFQDMRKKRFIEYENILGEALREGEKAGANMPTIKSLYGLCKAVQWRTMEHHGLVNADAVLKARIAEQ